ncbi:TPA: hypothetical protein HA231_02055 [Candidatus Woesearchaeota archaeon]|nr:hypothetical protein [Candidatus Woesearchaeota archaeon]
MRKLKKIKVSYQYGNWKKSALLTLQRLKAANDSGIKPKAFYFKNGAVGAWLVIFKQHGEVQNGDGFEITQKGIELMEQLKDYNFVVARGPRNINLLTEDWENSQARTVKNDMVVKTPDATFFIEIKGPNGLHIASNTSGVIAKKIIKELTQIN